MTVASVLTRQIPLGVLNNVRQPIADARGMPNAAYDDPALYSFERDHVMATTWAGLAFASELPHKAWVKPIDFMGLPLVMMRDKVGAVRVFHNVCSHRGMKLIRDEGKIEGMIRCPYHSWTYTLDGSLKGTPHIGGVGVHKVEGFSCENYGLREVRSTIWAGMIFINLSGDAPAFEEHIAPLLERWEAFSGTGSFDQLKVADSHSQMELTVNANWKLAVENYCEAYHLPWVHPALNTYSPLSQHYNIVANDYMSGQGSYTYNLSDVAGTTLPKFSAWPQDKIRQAEYLSLYPNVLLGVQADHVFMIILQPEAHDRTLEKLELAWVNDEACGEAYAAHREAVLESWKVVFGEDVFAVEGMQQGRKSPGFEGGVFSPVLDVPTHHFHAWVADRYAEAQS